MSLRDVLIVGAGPAGLATAIALRRLGLDYLVLEKGTVVDGIFRMPINMVFFTTPELLEIGGFPLTTPYEKPTRLEALRYYRKVVDACQVQVAMHEEVLSVEIEPPERAVDDGGAEAIFAVTTRSASGATRARHARAVVLAMGYYGLPNMLCVPGEDLPHVSHYFTEAHPYYRQRVVIVGGKNSACETALELFRAGAHVTLVHRGPGLGESVKYWVKPDMENRIKEGSIAARFNTTVTAITSTAVQVRTVESAGAVTGTGAEVSSIPADAVILLTGYHADSAFLEAAGVEIDPETMIPRHNPETFETNVPNIFIAGGQLAGKHTGTIFIENGRFHGEQIARVLASRFA
jgi:thioredoxin reductase (NADPH)